MRKMILLCTCVFLAIAGVCFTFAWFTQARTLQATVEKYIAKLNEKQTYITYDSLSTSGFPTSVNVAIVNPHFKGRADEFLKLFIADTSKMNLPQWDEDSVLAGSVSVGVNLFANQYNMHVDGAWRGVSTIGGKTYQMTTTNAGQSNCTLKMKSHMGLFGTLWDFKALSELNGKELVQDLRLLDCDSPGYSITDTNTNDVLMASGPIRFFVSSEEAAGGSQTRQVRVYLKGTDSEVSPKGDAVLAAYTSALFPGSPMAPNASVYGKRNVELDFSYNGPLSLEGGLKATPMAVDLNTFTLNNQVYQSQANFHYLNGAGDKGRTTKITFNAQSDFSEQYDALLRDMVKGFILQLYSPFVPQPANIQPLIRKYSADDLFNIVQPSLPNLHSLGRLTQTLDFNYNGDADMTAGDITFNNFALTAAPYGIAGRGSLQMTAGHPMPAANILLSCANCGRLVDDITDYTGRLQRTIATIAEQPIQGGLTPAQAEGVKAFLTQLSQPSADQADKTALNFAIVSDGVSTVTISGKRMDEVMAIYAQTIAPTLSQNQPASQLPVPPAAPAPSLMIQPHP